MTVATEPCQQHRPDGAPDADGNLFCAACGWSYSPDPVAPALTLATSATFGTHPDDPGPPEPSGDGGEFVSWARLDAERFDQAVEHRRQQLEINELAARQLRGQRAAERPPIVPLSEFLDLDLGEARYRIEGLLPAGGRLMLSAQYKAGKSTLVGNLVRSLADGDVFLGEHEVASTDGSIVLLDTELDRRMLQEWYRRQAIEHGGRVSVVSLRGRLSSFDLTDPHALGEWAAELRKVKPSFVILDPLRPVLDAIGLDERSEGGRFLVAFDELLDRCGAGEAAVVHHMGHDHERARGDSRLRDWPDVEWRLLRKDPDDPASLRYFAAYGRDVDRPEAALTFNRELGRLTIFGGSRKDGELKVIGDEILAVLERTPGLTGSKIETQLGESGHTRKNVRDALARLISDHDVATRPGNRNATNHYVTGSPALVAVAQEQFTTEEHAP